MTVGTDLADAIRQDLKATLEEGPPSTALKEIFDNLARASRQNAEAAERARAIVSPRMPALAAPVGRPTRFAEIDLSRTFVSGLSGGRRRKQEVKDVDVVNAVDRVELAVKGLHVATALMGP